MTTRPEARRDVRLLDALLRTAAHPRDVAVGVGAVAGVYALALFAVDLAGARAQSGGVRELPRVLALTATAVVTLAFTLAAPTAAGAAVVRDRASGAFDLAREAEPSAARRLAAYAFAPMWQSGLAVLAVFAASAPFAVDRHLPAEAWAVGCVGVLAFQAASSLLAATWALLLPRGAGANAQGVGVAAPIALGLPWALFVAVVHRDARPAVPLALAVGVASLWPVARALVDRPERPRHAPAAAAGAALCGLALGGLAWAEPLSYARTAPWLAAWAVLTAVAAGAWTLPRAGRLALALREGRRGDGLRAVLVSLGVSGLFTLGAAAVPSSLKPAPAALAEAAALVAAASSVATAALAVILAAPGARRGAYAGRAVFLTFASLLAEAALVRSPSPLAAQVDPLAGLWTSAPVAEGSAARTALFVAVAVGAAAVAHLAWTRAERRVEAAIDGAR